MGEAFVTFWERKKRTRFRRGKPNERAHFEDLAIDGTKTLKRALNRVRRSVLNLSGSG